MPIVSVNEAVDQTERLATQRGQGQRSQQNFQNQMAVAQFSVDAQQRQQQLDMQAQQFAAENALAFRELDLRQRAFDKNVEIEAQRAAVDADKYEFNKAIKSQDLYLRYQNDARARRIFEEGLKDQEQARKEHAEDRTHVTGMRDLERKGAELGIKERESRLQDQENQRQSNANELARLSALRDGEINAKYNTLALYTGRDALPTRVAGIAEQLAQNPSVSPGELKAVLDQESQLYMLGKPGSPQLLEFQRSKIKENADRKLKVADALRKQGNHMDAAAMIDESIADSNFASLINTGAPIPIEAADQTLGHAQKMKEVAAQYVEVRIQRELAKRMSFKPNEVLALWSATTGAPPITIEELSTVPASGDNQGNRSLVIKGRDQTLDRAVRELARARLVNPEVQGLIEAEYQRLLIRANYLP